MAVKQTYLDHIAHNRRVSVLLMFFMTALLGVVGAALGAAWEQPWAGVAAAVVVAGLLLLASYYAGDSAILAMSHAREIEKKDHPQLFNVVEELSIAAGLPMPKVYIIEEPAPNAFATGRDPQHASVAITRGLLEKLNREELQGVMAHEMSHVRNYDIRYAMLMAVMAGAIVLLCDFFWRMAFYGGLGGRRRSSSGRGGGGAQAVLVVVALLFAILAPIVATLIQLAVSRKREYLADASAVELTRYPEGLASALQKIAGDPTPLHAASRATQHLFICNPVKKLGDRDSVFSTHPPISERIARLRALASQSQPATAG
ncbi:MAG TPA: zinc metalloprotease HtpX [Candidatus Brocadiia bacterium]|nr:zinc metalloprotease HtpX [Candidatus Brocadiia bacterium]